MSSPPINPKLELIVFIPYSAVLIIVFSIANALYLKREQRRKESRRAEILAPYLSDPNTPSDGGERAWVELGDKHPDFRYAI